MAERISAKTRKKMKELLTFIRKLVKSKKCKVDMSRLCSSNKKPECSTKFCIAGFQLLKMVKEGKITASEYRTCLDYITPIGKYKSVGPFRIAAEEMGFNYKDSSPDLFFPRDYGDLTADEQFKRLEDVLSSKVVLNNDWLCNPTKLRRKS